MDVWKLISSLFWGLVYPLVLAFWTTLTVRFQLGYKFHLSEDYRTALQTVFCVVSLALWFVALFVYLWLPLVAMDL